MEFLGFLFVAVFLSAVIGFIWWAVSTTVSNSKPNNESPSEPTPYNPVTVTHNQWRRNEKFVEQSMKLRLNRVYTAQLDVLRVMHPARTVQPLGLDADRLLGRIEGFELCLNMLDSFAVPIEPKKPAVEATFEAPEEEAK